MKKAKQKQTHNNNKNIDNNKQIAFIVKTTK